MENKAFLVYGRVLDKFTFPFRSKQITKMDSINQYVIDKAKALRIKKKLTLYQWGLILGKTASFIGNVEHPRNPAKYNLVHLKTLAEYFNLSPRYFLPETIAELEQRGR
jgi:hypothetical protein